MMILIGIDTGVNTGFAVAIDHGDGNGGQLNDVTSMTITRAMTSVLALTWKHGKDNVRLFIEDARLRTWFTGGKEKAQGAGSVKRDASIWEQWCKENDLQYTMIHPKANATKYNANSFARITGWMGRTNEHGRDAAMLVHRRRIKI